MEDKLIQAKIGERVGAMRDAEEGKVYLFGFGVYKGMEIPPDEVYFMGSPASSLDAPIPKIELDNGEIVYGCECWWGPEEQIKKIIETEGSSEIVSIDDYRKEAKEIAERLFKEG